MPQIPPWIRPADEADYLGRGLQIGGQMTAEAAQEQYRNQQLMLEQAQAAQRAQEDQAQQALNQKIQDRLEKQFQIESQQAAAKSQALLGYQQALKGGMDPVQAILQFAPGFGQAGAATEVARALQLNKQLPLTIQQQGGESFYRTGPQSWQHIPSTSTQPQKLNEVEHAQLVDAVREERDLSNKIAKSDPGSDEAVKLMDERLKVKSEINKFANKLATAKPKTITPSNSENTVIRKTKDGRRAIFDANTKQFIRYADDSNVGGDSTGDSTTE